MARTLLQEAGIEIVVDVTGNVIVDNSEFKYETEANDFAIAGVIPAGGSVTLRATHPNSESRTDVESETTVKTKPVRDIRPEFTLIQAERGDSAVVSGFGYRYSTQEFSLTGELPPRTAIQINIREIFSPDESHSTSI